MSPTILTIGHSTHTFARFTELLRMHGVAAVADVRSSPYSRFNLDFSGEALQNLLTSNGFLYIYLGKELGGRSDDPSCYVEGRVSYQKLAQRPPFKMGVQDLLKGAQLFRTALLCAEREPLACHRTLLISTELTRLGVPVTHIHADGTLESQEDAMTRLMKLVGLSDKDLYRTRAELEAEACSLQEKRVAYVDDGMREEASA
jgi:uncharacterized protein (DUF488 family)